MSTLRLTGDVSGYAELRANSIAGSVIVTLPLISGNLVVTPTMSVSTNGSLLIGNTVSGGYDTNTLTQGTGIVITNTNGHIEIAATGGSATDQFARDHANGAFDQANAAYANANTAIYTAAQIRANISNTTPINYEPTTGVISHATSGVTATGYGAAAVIPVLVVNATGHLTSVTNTSIAFPDGAITTPSIPHAGDLDTGFWFPAADTIAASTTGLERLRITDEGLVGIGTTAPVADLEVSANAPSVEIVLTQYSGSPTIATDPEFHTQVARGTPGTPAAVKQNDTLFVFGASAYNGSAFTINKVYEEMNASEDWTAANNGTYMQFSTTANNSTSPGVRVRIDPSGNVGIGNTAPTNKLSVSGTSWFRDVVILQDGLNANGTLGVVGSVLTSNSATPRWTGASANGQLLIGNTVSGGFDVNTLTQGTNITITNAKGSITIDASGGGGNGFGIVSVSGQSDVVADQANDTLTLVGSGITITTTSGTDTVTLTHPTSGVTATGYGDAATVPKIVVDNQGHATSITNTAIAIAASAVTSGVLIQAQGGTGFSGATANGQLLIGNTVSSGFDRATLTQGTNITITNAKGSITIESSDAFAQAQANAAFNAANTASTQGLHTIWVPAWAMYPQLTNGASAANGAFQLTTNLQMLKTLDFDTTTAENAQFAVSMPNSWNEGTITANVVWSHGTTTTNFGVTWTLEGLAYSDNEAIDAAFGTPVPTSDTGGTANTVYISPPTSAITVGGTPSAGDWIVFRVSRQVANASDTMAIDARLHGVQIKYTTNASTEA